VKLFNVLIFYTFWGGIYYSPEVISGNRYIYNVYGYIIILLLLILEKGA
jgi:tetrahydromethanopterin S-methyltransferase subunit E